MNALIIVFAIIGCSRAEVYSSAADMKTIFRLERDLVDILGQYSTKLKNKLDQLDHYLEEVSEALLDRQEDDSDDEYYDRISGNPIHAYKLMKRFSVDWPKIESELLKKNDYSDEIELMIRKKKLGSIIPKDEDLHGSAQALIRVHDIYELDVRQLADGIVENIQTKARLSAQDCLFIGKHCFNSGNLARSLEWFEKAWVLAGTEGNSTVSQDQVQAFLDRAAQEHDQRVLRGEKNPKLYPKPVYTESPFDQRAKLVQTPKKIKTVSHKNFDKEDELINFNILCQGKEIRPQKYIAKLKCYYSDRSDPYYYLHPVSIEVMHLKPKIVMFHDVVSEGEMEVIRELAEPLMMRSQVQGMTEGSSEVSMMRTSKTGWLQDSFHPVVEKVSRRVGQITGLNTNTWTEDAELLQIANYINGGHYHPHHDYVLKDKDPNHMIYSKRGDTEIFLGDRIATWMVYMSKVTSGGRTVFPRIGAGVTPVPGSAVFWYNVLRSGEPDRLTLHGACPVLLGTKWVSNKWIREGAQIFTRPCGLSKDI